ncbi:caspase recruitment domain-containing protein 9 [Anolis sagrei]|uniref:caspase recruitment domain-containing protein 9 n=1 Tax=Anolis sagrei TaxID=38937 RepID=UPI003521A423
MSDVEEVKGEEEEEEEDSCWQRLESFRVKLTSAIDPSRITPYLRQCKVLSPDDEEQVLSDPSLVLRRRRAGLLLDLLQRTGRRGFVAFLESLELYYPQLYTKVTGKEPTRVFSMILDAAGESRLGELLMGEVCKLQALLRAERQRSQELAERLGAAEEALQKRRLREEDQVGTLALRYARQSQEKGAALRQNQELRLEIESLKHRLMKAEEDCKLERRQTLKLRQAIEQRPSPEVAWEKKALQSTLQLSEEKELLELRCASLRNDNRIYQDRIQTVLQQLEEVAGERDQGLATQEVLQRQYSKSLREKDVYRKQIRDLGEKINDLQLQLFQKERQLHTIRTQREPLQPDPSALTSDFEETSSQSSPEEVSKGDAMDLPPQKAAIFSLKMDEDPKGPENGEQFNALENMSQESETLNGESMEKGRRRMKDNFEQYRRKRALRRVHKARYHEVDWENSSGS